MKAFFAAVIFTVTSTTAVLSMEFSKTQWMGFPAISGSGQIINGDKERLLVAAQSATALPHGSPVLLLDSPGGSIEAAYSLAEAVNSLSLHTVIPQGADCASACGSIVFISGKYRTIEEGGRLGMHTCYDGGTGQPSEACNDRAANHAFRNGVSHGSVFAFMQYVSPDDMIFFDRSQADCYGLTKYFGTESSGFEKSEPCPIRTITGSMPKAQDAWRLDVRDGGYFAFFRPDADHDPTGELRISCIESRPGRLFFEFFIPGSAAEVSGAIRSVGLTGLSTRIPAESMTFVQRDKLTTSIEFSTEPSYTLPFLTKLASLAVEFEMKEPYTPMGVRAVIDRSRRALVFAANHCRGGSQSTVPSTAISQPTELAAKALLELTLRLGLGRRRVAAARSTLEEQARYARASRNGDLMAQTRAAAIQLNAQGVYLDGMQAIVDFSMGNPDGLNGAVYNMSGGVVQIQALSDGRWNVLSNNQVVQTLTKDGLVIEMIRIFEQQ